MAVQPAKYTDIEIPGMVMCRACGILVKIPRLGDPVIGDHEAWCPERVPGSPAPAPERGH